MTLFKIMDQPVARCPNIREDTDIGFVCADNKTMGVAGIVFFLKSGYPEATDLDRLLICKMKGKLPDFPETCFFHGSLADIYGNLVFRHQLVGAQNMITMFMGNKNRLYPAHIQSQ